MNQGLEDLTLSQSLLLSLLKKKSVFQNKIKFKVFKKNVGSDFVFLFVSENNPRSSGISNKTIKSQIIRQATLLERFVPVHWC